MDSKEWTFPEVLSALENIKLALEKGECTITEAIRTLSIVIYELWQMDEKEDFLM
mgnify:CR=1 FL=1